MPKAILGVSFSQYDQLLLLIVQLVCYLNQYYVVVFLLGPIPFWMILIYTLLNSRALIALYSANSIHLSVLPNSQDAQYCRKCVQWINNRDHHCIFTGRCVQKSNYCYFISYVLYSYILSSALVASILSHYSLLLNLGQLSLQSCVHLIGGLISGLYFMIFTAGLLSSSFRSIVLGIYTVDQLKKVKTPSITNSFHRTFTAMYFIDDQGRDFKGNWGKMVGDKINIQQILLVL